MGCPTGPTPSTESDAAFTRAYERAFAFNHELGSAVQAVTVDLQGTTVRAVGDGFRVRIHVWVQTDRGDATTESVLRRAETERHVQSAGNLRTTGLTLAW